MNIWPKSKASRAKVKFEDNLSAEQLREASANKTCSRSVAAGEVHARFAASRPNALNSTNYKLSV